MNWDAMVMDAASRQSFSRGESLAAKGAASIASAVRDAERPEILHLEGDVSESATARHRVAVNVNTAIPKIVSHACGCATTGAAEGLCKHAVCLLLSYQDMNATKTTDFAADKAPATESSPQVSLKEQTKRLLEEYKASASTPQHPRASISVDPDVCESQTSVWVSNIIFAYANERIPSNAPVRDQERRRGRAQELADVEVSISPMARLATTSGFTQPSSWEVRLKVRSGKTAYAVKRIDEVVDAWEQGSSYSYGKGLTFVHGHAAFTRRANDALEVVRRVLRTQQASRMSQTGYWSSGYGATTKCICMADADVADLLDAYMGARITYEVSPASDSPKLITMDVRNGDPEFPVSLEEGNRGGYDLYLPFGANCVLDSKRMYLFIDGHVWRCTEPFRLRLGPLCKALLPCESAHHIRVKDMPGFCGAVLPAIKDMASFETSANIDEFVPPSPEFSFRLSCKDGMVCCEALVSYGNDVLELFEKPAPKQPLRDNAREYAVRELMLRYFTWDAKTLRFAESDLEALHLFLTEGLAEMREVGTIYINEELKNVRIRSTPSVRVQATVKSSLMDIAIGSSDLSPRELRDYLGAYRRRERFVRLTNGDIVELGGGLQALVELAGGLGIDPADMVEGTTGVPLNRALFVDSIMKRSDGVRFDRDEGFRALIRQFDTIADADFIEPESLRSVLRPYQREGFKWLCTLDNLGFGAILADDMGLGKTLQMISFLLRKHELGQRLPSLVVCPASLVYNWMSELEKFAPQLRCEAVVGTQKQRRDIVENAREYDVLVTSYELMKRDVESYMDQSFYCQVLDEAQYIKNAATQAARSVKLVSANIRFALTGTPIENRLAELWSIFDFLMPGLLGTPEEFRERFEEPIAQSDKHASRRLQCMVGPFVLRRLKRDVLKDLPEKSESIVYTALTGEQERLYSATAANLVHTLRRQGPQEFASQQFAILAELTKLRQICCDPSILYENYEGESAKLEACIELVHTAVAGGHKVLLFSQFTSMLSVIGARLEQDGVPYHQLVGSTPKEQRARLVSSFQTDEVPVFLISLKAGGVGLNLTAADIVIHYDPWWNLAAQNQATDRAHRIGQTKSVNVMRLIAKNTIEEKMVALQESKRELAESILGGEAAGSASLTREDILALLD